MYIILVVVSTIEKSKTDKKKKMERGLVRKLFRKETERIFRREMIF